MKLTRSGRRRAARNNVISAYQEWRSECIAVQSAYRTWRAASTIDEPFAFDAYTAALDREEGAARLYARRLKHAGPLVETSIARELALAHIGLWI